MGRITTWFDNWIEERILVANSVVTNHRRTYVIPNRYGLMLTLIIILMLVAATNYQNTLGFLLTFVMMAVAHNTLLICYLNLTGLEFHVMPAKSVHVGQELSIPVRLKDMAGREHLSVGVGNRKGVQQVVDVTKETTTETAVIFHPEQRGWFQPPRFYLVTAYPFGLLRVWAWFRAKQQCLIYPKAIEPPAELKLQGGDSQDSSQDFKKGQEDFMSIRDYQQGDPKRAIHWRAYAREQGLVTKLYSEPVGDPMHFDYKMFDQIDPYQRVELRLSWLTFLVLEAAHQQTPFALSLPNQNFEPDMSQQHLEQCLEALALYQLESK